MAPIQRYVAAFALMLAATPALGQPAGYDRPYRGKLTVVHLSPWDIRKVCGGLAVACAVVGKGRCTIYMSPLDNWKTRQTYRHEIAHCNGWKH